MSAKSSDPPLDTSAPRLPDSDAPLGDEPMVAQAVDATTRLADAPLPVTPASLRAHLGRRATVAMIQRVVGAHVDRKTPRDVRDALLSDAVARILEAKRLPDSVERMDAWMASLTVRAVIDHFRRHAPDLRWLRRDVEVEDQPAEPPEEFDGDDAWLLTNWLAEQVKDDPNDQQTYDILLLKARTERTYEDIAAERGIQAAALGARIYRFKLKYLPVRHRHEVKRNRTILLLLLGGALLLVIAVLLWWLMPEPMAPPPPTRLAAPHSVRVPVEPPTFDNAAPTGPGPGPLLKP